MNDILQEISKRINRSDDIALYCHTKPDCDALGSMLALYVALKKRVKTFRYIAIRPFPTNTKLCSKAKILLFRKRESTTSQSALTRVPSTDSDSV